IRPGSYFLVVTAQPWYAQGIIQTGVEPSSQTRALDVVYPATFYPGVTDENSAMPIPVKGGERLKVDITLTAQQAARFHLNLATSSSKDHLMVMLSHSVFGQTEYVPAR